MSCTLAFYSSRSTIFGKLSKVTLTGFAYLNNFVISSLLWPSSSSLFCNLSLLSSLLLWCKSSTSSFICCALLWKWTILASLRSSSFFWTYLTYSVMVLYFLVVGFQVPVKYFIISSLFFKWLSFNRTPTSFYDLSYMIFILIWGFWFQSSFSFYFWPWAYLNFSIFLVISKFDCYRPVT